MDAHYFTAFCYEKSNKVCQMQNKRRREIKLGKLVKSDNEIGYMKSLQKFLK